MARLLESRLKVQCLTVGSVDELKTAGAAVLATRLVILDVNLGFGRPTGLDAYEWLRASKYEGKVFFLTGHARNDPLVKRAAASGARVLEKPFEADALVDLVRLAIKP